MLREISYDHVHDAQGHYRALLEALARPGTVRPLSHPAIGKPRELALSAACLALALLNRDVSFALLGYGEAAESYLRVNTGSFPARAEDADFVFLRGEADGAAAALETAKEGEPAYPEQSATFVVQLEAMGLEPMDGATGLELSGPGAPGARQLWLQGANADFFAALSRKNAEFPLGVDVFFVSEGPQGGLVAGLPRSTRFERLQSTTSMR